MTVGVDAASAPGRVVVAWRPEDAAAAELCERRGRFRAAFAADETFARHVALATGGVDTQPPGDRGVPPAGRRAERTQLGVQGTGGIDYQGFVPPRAGQG